MADADLQWLDEEEAGWSRLDLPRTATWISYVSGDPGGDRLRLRFFRRAQTIFVKVWFGPGAQGPPGRVHGGAMAGVLDEAMGAAAWVAGHVVLAAEITIRYRTMLPLETACTVEPTVVSVDGRKVRTHAEIKGRDGCPYAEADGLFISIVPDLLGDLGRTIAEATGGGSSSPPHGSSGRESTQAPPSTEPPPLQRPLPGAHPRRGPAPGLGAERRVARGPRARATCGLGRRSGIAVLLVCAVGLQACQFSYAVRQETPRAVVVATAPPEPPAEIIPPRPYEGAVWIAGHYDLTAEGWTWLPGAYVRPRPGYVWVPPCYRRTGDSLRFVPGYWRPQHPGIPPPSCGGSSGPHPRRGRSCRSREFPGRAKRPMVAARTGFPGTRANGGGGR